MGNQPWLDRVQQRLARQGLPPAYIRRFMEELSDHLEDLKEETMESDADARLGEPEEVAQAAVVAYRQRSFLGRHPAAAFLVFAVSPVIPQYYLLVVGVTVLMKVRADHTFAWSENHWILSLIMVVCSIFLSVLYGELAMRLGVGKKWTLASSAVLGTFAMLLETNFGVPLMVLAQFAAPLAVGWWCTKRKCNRGYPATAFLVFAVSPVASYTLLWFTVVLAFVAGQAFLNVYLGLTAVYVVPMVMAILLYCKFAKQFDSGRKWVFALCLVLVAFVATPLAPLLLIYVVPTGAASLLYCKLAKGFGSGDKWMLVSCLVLATFGTMRTLKLCLAGYETPEGHSGPLIVMTVCICMTQFLIPLGIGWWFMRRKHEQGRLELAA